jgi:hypothetical protein
MVVRMKSGDPRYHPMITSATADKTAAERNQRERGMRGVSR